MATTIKDIAREAGVSAAAVSSVLHGTGSNIRVGVDRANLIRDVAHQLNYVPNAVARNLRAGKSRNIGLVFENFGSISAGPLYYAYLFDGITHTLFKNHYRLTILPEMDTKHAHREFGNGQLDGLIWCKFVDDPATEKMLKKVNLPVVALNALQSNLLPNALAIACDNEAGSELAVDHLFQLGHRKIAFVNEISEEQTPDSTARYLGYVSAMKKRGLEVSESDLITWSTNGTEFPVWWANRPQHTALYVWNEGLASRILRRAQNAGVDIPEQLSILGFDSTEFSEHTTPPLTAVRQPIREMAEMAAESLLKMIEGETPQSRFVNFPVSLDIRGSTLALTQSRVGKP